MSPKHPGGSGSKGGKRSGRPGVSDDTYTMPPPRPPTSVPPCTVPMNLPQRPAELIFKPSVQQLIHALTTHRVNTLTELCRIERIAAGASDPVDAGAFQEPMTAAWVHYVASNQFLTELRGLTPNFPLNSALVDDALARVRADPESNRSWNVAFLCLVKMKGEGLVQLHAAREAVRPEMWGSMIPGAADLKRLAECFETEWAAAVDTMLRHWPMAPTWY